MITLLLKKGCKKSKVSTNIYMYIYIVLFHAISYSYDMKNKCSETYKALKNKCAVICNEAKNTKQSNNDTEMRSRNSLIQ